MESSSKLLILFIAVFAMGVGLVFWKDRHVVGSAGFSSVNKQEMELLVSGLPPQQQQQIAASPEGRKQLVNNVRRVLQVASEAEKQGLANSADVQDELKYTEKAIIALSYDKEKNKGESMAPMSMITTEQIAAFWGEDPNAVKQKEEQRKKEQEELQKNPEEAMKKQQEKANQKPQDNQKKQYVYAAPTGTIGKVFNSVGLGWIVSKSEVSKHEREFAKFLKVQKAQMAQNGMSPEGAELSPDQLDQMKDAFARFSIYDEEAKENWDSLPKDFKDKVAIQTKMQQAMVLANLYNQKFLVKELEVTPEDVKNYINQHPELTKESKAKADEVLKKAVAGEDFAKLAKEYSQDPGSKDNGGLYADQPMGRMVPVVQNAALSLQPGQVDPNLVESDFGYHVIKLENKGTKKVVDGKESEVYSFRHVLITTTVKDTESQFPQEVPLSKFVSDKLKKEKLDSVLAVIDKNNPVSVAEDFAVNPPPMPPQSQMPDGMQVPQQGGQQGPPQSRPQGSGTSPSEDAPVEDLPPAPKNSEQKSAPKSK